MNINRIHLEQALTAKELRVIVIIRIALMLGISFYYFVVLLLYSMFKPDAFSKQDMSLMDLSLKPSATPRTSHRAIWHSHTGSGRSVCRGIIPDKFTHTHGAHWRSILLRSGNLYDWGSERDDRILSDVLAECSIRCSINLGRNHDIPDTRESSRNVGVCIRATVILMI